MFIKMQKPNFCKCYTTGSCVGQSKFAVWWKVSRKCEPWGNMSFLIPKLPPFPSCLSSSAPSPPRQEGSPTCLMFWSLLRSLWQDLFHFHPRNPAVASRDHYSHPLPLASGLCEITWQNITFYLQFQFRLLTQDLFDLCKPSVTSVVCESGGGTHEERGDRRDGQSAASWRGLSLSLLSLIMEESALSPRSAGHLYKWGKTSKSIPTYTL